MENQKYIVPSDLKQIFTISKFELLNYRRSGRFLILLLLIVGASFAATLVIAYFRPASLFEGPVSFLTRWIGYTVVFVIALPSSFLGGDAISSEFQAKTGYSMIVNPMRRSSMFLGKVIAAALASLFMLALYELITIGNVLYYFGAGSIPILFWESCLFTMLATCAALGLAFCFSALIRNGAISMLFSAFLLLYGFNLLGNVIQRLTNIEPWFLLTYGAQIIENIFSTPYPEHITTFSNHVFYIPTVVEGVTIMFGYFVVGMVVSLAIFLRKEFN